MRYRKIFILIFACILSISLIGCQGKDITNDHGNNTEKEEEIIEYEPAYGGKLGVPITYIDTFNPILNKEESLYYFNKLIFEGLFEFNEELDVSSALSQDYEIKDEGKEILIKLRDDVYWHDGEKFTSEDVRFTVNVLKYGSRKSAYRELLLNAYKLSKPSDLEHILNVNIIDEYNLSVEFDRSYSNALETLIFPIIPKHAFVKQEDKSINVAYERALDVNYEFKPIGTGPYKFIQYEKLKTVKLSSNEDWWNEKPYISTIIGSIIPNEETSIQSFESGQIDLALSNGFDWEKYMENEDVEIYEYITQDYEFLGFNFNNDIFKGKKGKELRKSISYAIDRKSIIQKIFLGHATSTDLPINPESWLISDEELLYNYNPEKSKKILESLGWVDSDNDGIRENSEGKVLQFKLLTNSQNSLRQETAEIIVQNLKEIGISIIPQYKKYDDKDRNKQLLEKQWSDIQQKIYNGNFDIVLLGWRLSHITDLAFAFHSSQIDEGYNFISYTNDQIDRLIVDAFRAKNRIEKKNRYAEIQSLILDELPYVSLVFKNSSVLINDRVKGSINPKSYNIYNNIEEWFIPKQLQKESEK